MNTLNTFFFMNTNQITNNKSLIKFIPGHIFPHNVILCYGYNNYDKLRKDFLLDCNDTENIWYKVIVSEEELLSCPSTQYVALHRTIEDKQLFMIFIRDTRKISIEFMTIIAHESLHICQFAFPFILDMNREIEGVAYYHSYLMRTIGKSILKHNKSNNNG